MQSMSPGKECLRHEKYFYQHVMVMQVDHKLADKFAGQQLTIHQIMQEVYAGTQTTKRCHWECDLLRESTWIVGNKQQREVWQLIVDRRQGSDKTTACR